MIKDLFCVTFRVLRKYKFALLWNRKHSKEANAITVYFIVFFLKINWDKVLGMLDSKQKRAQSPKNKDSAPVHKCEKLGNVPR